MVVHGDVDRTIFRAQDAPPMAALLHLCHRWRPWHPGPREPHGWQALAPVARGRCAHPYGHYDDKQTHHWRMSHGSLLEEAGASAYDSFLLVSWCGGYRTAVSQNPFKFLITAINSSASTGLTI